MWIKQTALRQFMLLLSFSAIAVLTCFLIHGSVHFFHDYGERDCGMCHEMQIVEGFIRSLNMTSAETVCCIKMVIVIIAVLIPAHVLPRRTLVLEKVRMDR